MKLKLERLILQTKQKTISISFSNSVTYFYGKMGTGKSTIARLVNFCLGGELKETPALQSEFLSVSLELIIEKYVVKLDRQRGSSEIIAAWKNKDTKESNALPIPVRGIKDKFIMPDKKIENISDFIFYLGNLEPPYVLKSKHNVETELIRLSFRDIMWYCYLDQDHIDSSLFYLEYGDHPFKINKSQDAIRYILGFEHEEISKLQKTLNQLRQDRSSHIESVKQLNAFLEENGIKNSNDIMEQIESHTNQLAIVKNQEENIRDVNFNQSHPIDNFKDKSRELSFEIDRIKQKIEDNNFEMIKLERLKSEFITTNIRIDRTDAAREVFRNIRFETCPQCGQIIEQESSDTCLLCKRPPKNTTIENIKLMGPDLIDRIKEIDNSHNSLFLEKRQLEFILKSKQFEKLEIDEKLVEQEKNYDSKYLTEASELLQSRGIIEGKIYALKQMLPLPQRVDELKMSAEDLTSEIGKIEKQLDQLIDDAKKGQTALRDLEDIFLDTLREVKFPGLKDDDYVTISSDTYIPTIRSKNKEDSTVTTFSNVSSGGMKTIFKACFAIAIHRLANKINRKVLPTFLIIDTPMKNISERENKDVYNGFYKFLYKLAQSELKDTQFIIIDKEFEPHPERKGLDMTVRHMTKDDPKNPPLIDYYKGH